MRPGLGFRAKIPHQPAGSRTAPPISVPMWSGPYPAAAAAAAPLDEPPGVLLRSHGLRVRAWKLERLDESMPKSGMDVFEKITAPASRRRATGGASSGASLSVVASVPSGTGTPFEAMFSLTVTGTPSIGLSARPSRQRASDARAAA